MSKKTKRQRDRGERRRASASDRAEKQRGGAKPYLALPRNMKLFDFKKEGTKNIDLIEYVVGKGNPEAAKGDLYFERTFYVHKGLGPDNEDHLCPKKTLGKPCPVCKHRKKAARGRDDDDGDTTDLRPKERQLFALVDPKNKNDGIQIMDKSYHLFGNELDIAVKKYKKKHGKEVADAFASPTEGMRVQCEVEEKSYKKASYTGVKMAKLVERDEQYEEDELEVPCLDKLLVETPYEELKELFLQSGEDDDSDDSDSDDDSDDDEDDDESDDSDDDDDSEDDEDSDDEDDDSDEDDDDEDEDVDDDDEDDDDSDGDPEKGDVVRFTYKGKKRKGTVKRIKNGMVHVKCDNRTDPYAVDADDCTIVEDVEDDEDDEDEKPRRKGKKAKGKKREDDEDDEAFDEDADDDEDDEEEKPRKKKKRRR